jgi:phenylacetate-CoA ligase
MAGLGAIGSAGTGQVAVFDQVHGGIGDALQPDEQNQGPGRTGQQSAEDDDQVHRQDAQVGGKHQGTEVRAPATIDLDVVAQGKTVVYGEGEHQHREGQVEAAAALKPDAYAGTPDFLKIILDKADEMGVDLSSITLALVSGGALFPALREGYAQRGVTVLQCYATADLGVIAYESAMEDGPLPGMIVSEDIILEIVRPGTDDPVAPGEVGEIVVTRFNPAYPLIRFGTGDLSAVLDEPSPCGRTNLRIKGWMGRADQRTKVKGMFVDPKQVDRVVKAHPEIDRARLVVSREGDRDVMTLQVTTQSGTPNLEAIAATLKAETRLSGQATHVDDLPNDGKVIDDIRDYDS